MTTLKMFLANFDFRMLVSTLAVLATFLTSGQARANNQIYRKALPSTVWVLAKANGETSSGTGVLVDLEKKLIITNFHVVGEARAAVIFFPVLKDGHPIVSRQHYLDNVKSLGIRGRILSVDRKRDLALIELDKLPADATAIPLATAAISPGENVQSIGNPGSTDALWAFTSGTVRSVYQKTFRTGAGEHDFKVVETQAPINSGDSGGPVVNDNGELVAIAQAIAPNARLVSYSVDLSEVKEFLASPWKPAPLPASDLLTRADLKFTVHKTGHLEVEFEEKDVEQQTVFVAGDVEYFEKADVRKVWSLAGTLKTAPDPDLTLRMLEQNGRTKLGAWMTERSETGEYMLIYCVKLDATASPEVLKSTMGYVAKYTRTAKKDLLPNEASTTPSQTLDTWLTQ